MCDPVSAVTTIGAGIGIYGQVKAGRAAEEAGKRDQASYEELARLRLEKVAYDTRELTRNYRRTVGGNVTQIGQSGITRSSFYDVLADDAAEFVLAKDAIKFTGANEAEQLRRTGAVAAAEGQDALNASYINAGSVGLNALSGMVRRGVDLSNPFGGTWQTTTYTADGQLK